MQDITNETNAPERAPLFVVDTVYDTERYTRFNATHFLSQRWFIILMGAATGILTLAFLFGLALIGFDAELLIYTCGLWLFDALYLFLVLVLPRFTFKKSAAYMSLSHTEFFDDGFIEDSRTDAVTSHTEHSYTVIKKLRESRTDIYIYIAPNQAYIVAKDSFSVGNPESLKRFLYTKVDPKIVKYRS